MEQRPRQHEPHEAAAGQVAEDAPTPALPGGGPARVWLAGWEPPGPDDVAAITAQIGRPARGLVAVAARCRFGKPAVVVVSPVLPTREGIEPFPTTFWLTCPYLVAQVSALESEGWIGRLAAESKADPRLARELEQAHQAAATLRRALAGQEALQRLARLSPRAAERIATSGVAGIRHPAGIKCLHAHLADYLGRGANPIGRRVTEILQGRGVDLSGHADCPSERQLEEAKRPP